MNKKNNFASPFKGQRFAESVIELLCNRGYAARINAKIGESCPDAFIGSLAVEIKGSKIHPINQKYSGFSFAIKRITASERSRSAITILFTEKDLFIIPTSAIHCNFIAIPYNGIRYSGKWVEYLNRFDILDTAIARDELPINQLPIFTRGQNDN